MASVQLPVGTAKYQDLARQKIGTATITTATAKPLKLEFEDPNRPTEECDWNGTAKGYCSPTGGWTSALDHIFFYEIAEKIIDGTHYKRFYYARYHRNFTGEPFPDNPTEEGYLDYSP